MNKVTKQQILNEAMRIGDELLSLAENSENGMSWKTMSIDYMKKETDPDYVIWNKSEGIYTGVSGISLFLLELYKQTNNEEYLNAAREGMRWVEATCQDNATDYYAFFTGRMGVAYSMLKLAEVTKEDDYLQKALTIAKPCAEFLDSPTTIDDLINGTSGTLLGLLHIHAATGEDWVLEKIDLYINHLVHGAHHGAEGLYWDRSSNHIQGLCGFSHGAAGIGFVFLELAHYFKNDSFYWMAEQAFLYESHCFKESRKNWPDFRKGIFTPEDYQEHEQAYLEGNLDFFTTSGDMNAWCHGAAGIGLSRLRAFELLKKTLYKSEGETALEKTKMTDVDSQREEDQQYQGFTLCHGSGGNAEVFLEAYKVFNNEKYLSLAESVAQNALQFKNSHNIYLSGFGRAGMREDTSLFMGNAGIGYFYLKLFEPQGVPSILAPKVDSVLNNGKINSKYSHIAVSTSEIKKIVLEKVFKRTVLLSEKRFPEEINLYLNNKNEKLDNRESLIDTFPKFMENTLTSLPQEEKERISDIFGLELDKMRMDVSTESHALLHIKELVLSNEMDKLGEIGDDSFAKLKFIMNPDIMIKLTYWNWSFDSQDNWMNNLHLEPEMYPVLLRRSVEGIVEIELSPFVYTVFTVFQNGNIVENAIGEIIKEFDSISTDKEKEIKNAVIQQIQQGALSGILMEDK